MRTSRLAPRSSTTAERADPRGRHATSPAEIPPRGWMDVAARVRAESKVDQVPLLAAGVAFYALLALVPALIAAISTYGLVADPADIAEQIESLAAGLPSSARDLLVEQMDGLVERSSVGLGITVVVSIAVALWSASSGIRHLVEALNVAYDEEDSRGMVRLRLLSLGLTAAAVVGATVALGLITALPRLLESTGLGQVSRVVLTAARWPLLAVLFAAALAVLYRIGPDRDAARIRWLSWGALLATAIWILASVLFSVYVERFSSFGETYGSLAGIIVMMLWLQITSAAVLVGAELNSELERQTVRDSTVDEPEPLGRRGARAADTVGPTASEVRR